MSTLLFPLLYHTHKKLQKDNGKLMTFNVPEVTVMTNLMKRMKILLLIFKLIQMTKIGLGESKK